MKTTDELVSRFLAWPLPVDVAVDPCAMALDYPGRTGTNLLTAEQAKAMLEHVLGDVLAEALKCERRAIAYGDIVAQHTIAMRAAVVAWQREDASAGMEWIANTLCGPGHLPGEESIALGAQAMFDKEMAEHEAFRAAHPAP